MKKKTKIQLILEHLQNHGMITPKESVEKYNYWRLSDGIFKLKKRGYDIKTTIKQSFNGSFAEYTLNE